MAANEPAAPRTITANTIRPQNDSRGVLILGGPTASGKTEFAISLAERYGAEIIGADSRQIYRGMPVGTAAPTTAQRARIPHHLIGFVDPYERYSAARFVADAAMAIAAIHQRGKRAIVAGGTGFYLRALCGDVELAAEPDPALRARVAHEARIHPPDVLYDWLRARDPRRATAIAARDAYRIVRALEIDLGRTADRENAGATPAFATLRAAGIPFVKIALHAEKTDLAARITARTQAMIDAGLVDEAARIGLDAVAADAVGYREAMAYGSGWLTMAELRTALMRATRRYAKRQLTWFRGEADLQWVQAGDIGRVDAAVVAIGWTPVVRAQELT